MLKAVVLSPSKDIQSYKNYKEYPFVFLPSMVLVYSNFKTIKLDSRELAMLIENYENEKFIVNFGSIKNPKKILIQHEKNSFNLCNKKINFLKKILPFCKNINNLIIEKYEEKLSWGVRKKGVCSRTYFSINKYEIKNESAISYDSLLKPKYRTSLYKIVKASFEKGSYKPLDVETIYPNRNNINLIPIMSNKKSKLLFFTKKQIKERRFYSDDEDDDDEYHIDNVNCENIFVQSFGNINLISDNYI